MTPRGSLLFRKYKHGNPEAPSWMYTFFTQSWVDCVLSLVTFLKEATKSSYKTLKGHFQHNYSTVESTCNHYRAHTLKLFRILLTDCESEIRFQRFLPLLETIAHLILTGLTKVCVSLFL